MRIIKFAPCNSYSIILFAENGLLKLDDVITCSKLKLAFDFKNNEVAENLNALFKYCHDVHSHRTCTLTNYSNIVMMYTRIELVP